MIVGIRSAPAVTSAVVPTAAARTAPWVSSSRRPRCSRLPRRASSPAGHGARASPTSTGRPVCQAAHSHGALLGEAPRSPVGVKSPPKTRAWGTTIAADQT